MGTLRSDPNKNTYVSPAREAVEEKRASLGLSQRAAGWAGYLSQETVQGWIDNVHPLEPIIASMY
jgi:hypothetical protein